MASVALAAVLGAGYASLRLARSTKPSQALGSPYTRQAEGRDPGHMSSHIFDQAQTAAGPQLGPERGDG
jgi:hypothetical protein